MAYGDDDPEPCRLRNLGGVMRLHAGACNCPAPKDCPNPPPFTPLRMHMTMLGERIEAMDDPSPEGPP